MIPQTEFMEQLVKLIQENCSLDSGISLKELSNKNSLYAELGEGFTNVTYFDKSTVRTFPVLFLCRNADQRRCLEQLAAICNYLQRLRNYPPGESYRWLDAETAKEPSRIGRGEDGAYHYSCIVNCKLFF